MYSSPMPLGPGGVDVMGNLASKMELQLKDTEQVRTSFENDIRMYKNKQISKKEFVHKVVTYTISLSALNFLVIHVILEMRTALEKGSSMKDNTGGIVVDDQSDPGSQFGLGIEGFLGSSFHGRSGDGGVILTDSNATSIHAPCNICNCTETDGSYDKIQYRKDQKNIKEYPLASFVPRQCVGCGTVLFRPTNFCGTCGYKQ
jgi:hypothetical protein